ncbi:MAG: hypothetical protein QM520_00020 [Gammaproteobacteria bacterium]|nr:hypothetical protein [Gammaproteobacteria bacterium]
MTALGSQFEGLLADFGKADGDIFFKDPPFAQLAEFAQRYKTVARRLVPLGEPSSLQGFRECLQRNLLK